MSKLTGAETVTWDLSDLYASPSDRGIDEVLASVVQKSDSFYKAWKGRLSSLNASELAGVYKELEELLTPLYKVSQYASLLQSEDVNNEDVKQLVSRVDDISAQVQNNILFLNLEIGNFSKKHMDNLLKDSGLFPYLYAVKRAYDTATYNLSEKEEQLINLKDMTGVDAFQKLYSEVVSNFVFEFDLDGKKQRLNGSQLRSLRQHEDPDVRRRAMVLFFQTHESHHAILTHAYNNIVKDYNTERQLRGYTSPISIRNTGNDLDNAVVETLHSVTEASYPLVQRYYTIKRKILELETLTLADIYAPMPKTQKRYTWDEAKTTVLDGFKAFDSDFYDFAQSMFKENRIHAPVMPSKRGGAFCSGATPDIKPYIMVNFQGLSSDISTLAHECGHAIHDMFASKQTLFNYFPILPLAETASVFSEMLITDQLLSKELDQKEKQAILTEKLEDIFATSHRQNMFSRFEQKAHDAISKEWMSADSLCELYNAELNNMFGQSVTITPEYRWEWSSIPHIFEYPFYVYAYNFGNLLVMSLYQMYKETPATFPSALKSILASGSVESPIAILKHVDADISDRAFWNKSIVYIESLLDELELTLDI
jgi:oligoendopeptidase F